MRIALLGANSQIAKDLILRFSWDKNFSLHLFSRDPEKMKIWLTTNEISQSYLCDNYSNFLECIYEFDGLINFVGSGDPARILSMGKDILDITKYYDDLATAYIRKHPNCKYIFISSGAVFGSFFETPVDEHSQASINVNNLQPQDWYGIAKLYAECGHRALVDLPIVDIRVFNYFSHSHDINSRYLISEILKSIKENLIFHTTLENITRDFLHPDDFFRLVNGILMSPPVNNVVDCFTREPINKLKLLEFFKSVYGLNYKFDKANIVVNATGNKSNYYSLSRAARRFGYEPCYSSFEGIAIEAAKIL